MGMSILHAKVFRKRNRLADSQIIWLGERWLLSIDFVLLHSFFFLSFNSVILLNFENIGMSFTNNFFCIIKRCFLTHVRKWGFAIALYLFFTNFFIEYHLINWLKFLNRFFLGFYPSLSIKEIILKFLLSLNWSNTLFKLFIYLSYSLVSKLVFIDFLKFLNSQIIQS